MAGEQGAYLVYRTEAGEAAGGGPVDVPFVLKLSTEAFALHGLGSDGQLLDIEASSNELSSHQAAVMATCLHHGALAVPELHGEEEEAVYPGLEQLLRVNGSPGHGWRIASENELNDRYVIQPAAAAFTAHHTPQPASPAEPQTSLLPQVLGFVVNHAAQQEAAAAATAQRQAQPQLPPLLKPQAAKPPQGLRTPSLALTRTPWLPLAGHTPASEDSRPAAAAGSKGRVPSARLAAHRAAAAADSAAAASGSRAQHSHSPQLSQQAPAPAPAQVEGSSGEADSELQKLRASNWELRARAVELRELRQKLAGEQTLLALRRRQRRELEERVERYRGMMGAVAGVLSQGPF